MKRGRRTQAIVVSCAGLLGIGTACGRELLGPELPAPQTPHFYEDTWEEEAACPDNVPPEACEPMSSAERQTLYWDILQGVKWDIEECATVGNRALDHAQYGEMRKYPMLSSYFDGYWQPASRNPWGTGDIIAIRADRMLIHGDRMQMMVHESSHSRWNRGEHGFALYDPYWAQYNCINW